MKGEVVVVARSVTVQLTSHVVESTVTQYGAELPFVQVWVYPQVGDSVFFTNREAVLLLIV